MATNRNIRTDNDTHVRNRGVIQKRFELNESANNKVETYRKLLSAKRAVAGEGVDPTWVQALEDLIETHPRLKKLK
jgi:hypothetical protein